MIAIAWLVLVISGFLALAYVNASGAIWTAALAGALVLAAMAHALPIAALALLGLVFVLLGIALNMPGLRRSLISDAVFAKFRKVMPPMSDTEREALEAGTVWWDGELFSGRPNWRRLLDTPTPRLTPEEQRFLDHDVAMVCDMVNEWQATSIDHDLPPHVWQFIKDRGFLGMIIPREYGGLGFSAYAHSEVVTRLSTRSGTLAVSVLVPNSLGPGELLLHYGTEAQKRHYLPRLAKGLEIPCFALTNPKCRLRRCIDPRPRHRLLGRARRPTRARALAHLGEALHHARPRRDDSGVGLPRL